MPVPPATWPFAGREAELAATLQTLEAPGTAGVLLTGAPGSGKTRLLDAAVRALTDSGRVCTRLVGAEATRHIPFAALAAGLPTELLDDGAELDVVRVLLAVRRRHAHGLARGERALLAVDDIALVDEASLAVVSQLVTSGAAMLLGTMRDDVAPPAAVASMERAASIQRLEVGPLTEAEAGAILEGALGAPVEPASVRTLWTVTEGNVLFLQEVVRATVERGSLALRHGHWRLDGPLHATSRLVETLGERLARLPPHTRTLCETLALAEPLHLNDIERAGWLDAALALEAVGLAKADGDGNEATVRLAHPLYGELLRAGLTPIRRRQHLRNVADVVAAAGRRDDELRIAAWLLDAGAPAGAELLRRAAARARGACDFALTERLAGAAATAEPELQTLALHGEALYSLGRVSEAEHVLAEAARFVRDDRDRSFLVTLHHRILMWGTVEVDRSIEIVRDALARMTPGFPEVLTRATLANALAFHTDPRGALDLLADLADLPDPDLALLVGFVRSIAHTRTGDPVRGAEIAAAIPRSPATAPLPAASNRPHPALVDLAHGFALVERGRLDEARRVVEAAYRDVVVEGDPQMHVWFPLVLARVEVRYGHTRAAQRWFAQARSEATGIGFATGVRMALAGLSLCAGLSGDEEEGRLALDELDRVQPDIGFLAAETELGRAWALHGLGRHDDALAALGRGVDTARRCGDDTLAHHLAYEAVRLGGSPEDAAGTMQGLAVRGELAAARRHFVDGLHRCSAEELARAEAEFSGMGMAVAAAEAAAQVSVVLQQTGTPREAAAAAARARVYHAALGASPTPLALDAGSDELTTREREVAELAAGGMASKAIARELGLSVRTVSNHLQRAYAKLGVGTRTELAGALERQRSG